MQFLPTRIINSIFNNLNIENKLKLRKTCKNYSLIVLNIRHCDIFLGCGVFANKV